MNLVTLYTAIRDAFAAEGASTEIVFGAREPARQINQGPGVANRVVIDPADGQQVGTLEAPRMPGGNPKRVGSLVATATIYVWAYDGSTAAAASDESAQYAAVRTLFVRVHRILWELAAGEIQFTTVKRVKPDKREMRLGDEWQFAATIIDDLQATADEAVIRTDADLTVEIGA